MFKKVFFITIVLSFYTISVQSGQFDFRAEISAEMRIFPKDVQFADQKNYHFAPSFKIEPEFIYELDSGNDRFTFVPFFRYDLEDDNRTHFDIRELNWIHFGSKWTFLVGNDIVFWGVAESRHLVDIINQIDFVEDIDNEDKLGQPMVFFSYETEKYGAAEFYFMPYFRERTFPSADARLRGPLPISENPEYESDLEEFHPDFAFRWFNTINEFDVGLSFFYGTSREPIFLTETDESGNQFFRPFYQIINQVGLDAQWTRDAWLLKLEVIGRGGQGSYFFATVFGFEYTFFQVFSSNADLGVLSEYLYDGRDENLEFAPPTFFNHDIFFGLRYTLNDIENTEFLAGLTTDTKTGEMLGFIETSRRFGENWVAEIEARLFLNSDGEQDIFEGFKNDSFINISIGRYF